MYYFSEMFRIENNSHMLGITLKIAIFNLLKTFMALTRLLSFKPGLIRMKLRTQQYLVKIILLKCLEFKTIVICLKLSAKMRFKGY